MKSVKILLIVISLLTIFTITAGAYSEEVPLPDIPSGYPYYIELKRWGTYYDIILSTSPFVVTMDGKILAPSDGTRHYGTGDSGEYWSAHEYNLGYHILNVTDYTVLSASETIYYEDGTVFFSVPKPPLTQALRQVDSQTPVKTLLAGGVVSLIPLLIGLIVGAVALRKAWVFLKTGLKKA